MKKTRHLPVWVLLLLLVAGSVSAISIETTKPFAETRNGDVTWAVQNTPFHVDSLTVKANTIMLEDAELDILPDGGVTADMVITDWTSTDRAFETTFSSSSQLRFNMSNPGFNYAFYLNGLVVWNCLDTNSTCEFTRTTTATTHTWNVRLVTGSLPAVASPISATSSGSSSTGTTPTERILERFPQLTGPEWLGIAAGAIILANGFPRARKFVGGLTQFVPLPPDASLMVGLALILFIFLP